MFSEFNRYLNPYPYGSKVTGNPRSQSRNGLEKLIVNFCFDRVRKEETNGGHLEFKSAQLQ